MSLTAGTALQNGRYVIQSVLSQSDLGVTYQATHMYLDQSVIIQTLNRALLEHYDATQLQQQFLDGLRRLTKGQIPYPVRVLDYFTEANLPFAVMEYVPGQVPPKLRDWLPQLEQQLGWSNISPSPALVSDALGVMNGAVPSATVYPPTSATAAAIATPNQQNGGISKDQAREQPVVIATSPVSPVSSVVKERSPQPQPPKRNRHIWFPFAFVTTSVVAAVGGAALGWIVRFSHPTQSGITPPIFSQEQAFPPTDGWPIRETPDLTPESTWEESNDIPHDVPAPATRRNRTYIPNSPSSDVSEESVPSTEAASPEPELLPEAQDPLPPDGTFQPEPVPDSPDFGDSNPDLPPDFPQKPVPSVPPPVSEPAASPTSLDEALIIPPIEPVVQ